MYELVGNAALARRLLRALADFLDEGARQVVHLAVLVAAQAAGDFASLESHDLPVITINLSADVDAGLAALRRLLEDALNQPLRASEAATADGADTADGAAAGDSADRNPS